MAMKIATGWTVLIKSGVLAGQTGVVRALPDALDYEHEGMVGVKVPVCTELLWYLPSSLTCECCGCNRLIPYATVCPECGAWNGITEQL